MDKKVFELVIDEQDESGVSAIALVDEPAIERDFLKFDKQKHYKFQVDNEEKRIISGYAMIADLPIPRMDKEIGEHFVIFRKPTIESIVDKFMRSNQNDAINLMHDPARTTQDVFVMESIIIDEERGQFAPESFEPAPDGSWWVSMRVLSDEVWQAVKNEEFKGFSVEGGFGKLEPVLEDEDIINDVIKDLEAEFKSAKESDDNYKVYQQYFEKMNKEELKEKVKSLLFEKQEEVTEEKFVEASLADGTIVNIEPEITIGASVSTAEEGEEAQPAPDGDHELADGRVITTAGGVITDIVEVEEAGEEVPEEEMSDEQKRQAKTIIERTERESKFLSEAPDQIEALTKRIEELEAKAKTGEEFADQTLEFMDKFKKSPSKEPTLKIKKAAFVRGETTLEEDLKKLRTYKR